MEDKHYKVSLGKVKRKLADDPQTLQNCKDNPHEEVPNIIDDVGKPLDNDVWIYRIVVGALSLTLVSCVIGAICLQVKGQKAPELLTGLGTGALGALAGLLAPSPSRN